MKLLVIYESSYNAIADIIHHCLKESKDIKIKKALK